MSLQSSLRAAWYFPLTLALAPGIPTHECAHVATCRLSGVAVHSTPSLNPSGRTRTLTTRRRTGSPRTSPSPSRRSPSTARWRSALALPFLWLGGCFAWTAIPSPSHTDGLFDTAGGLPARTRPFGYLLAIPVRAATLLAIEGIGGLLWTVALYVALVG